jgi:putative cell wall-binding protein
VLCAALASALVPGPAFGASTRTDVTVLGTTYDIDNYDASGMGDDTPALTHDVTAKLTSYAVDQTEAHTLDLVFGTNGDTDWVRFNVTSGDLLDKASFLFRATSTMYNVDTVIEVYGPHASSSFPYTDGWLSGEGDPIAQASNDEDYWRDWSHGTHDSGLLFRPSVAGTYYVRIRPYAGGGIYNSEAGSYTLHMKRGLLQRVDGATRIQTAIEVSRLIYGGAPGPEATPIAVVVANAFNFPDALGGSVLAGISDGVLLLTPPNALPAEVGAEITRLGAQRIYVVGGEAAVGPAVVTALQALPGNPPVYRVEGDDRYMTAVEVALQAQSDVAGYGETMPHLAILAYGQNFPDALAASAYSAARNVPILLTNSATLHPDTDEAFFHLGTTDVIIVGGTAVISAAIENQLKTRFGSGHVLRIAGDNRYETAKEFAAWACDIKGPGARDFAGVGTPASPNLVPRLQSRHFGIASGETFPDALAGGAACGLVTAPILLNSKSNPYGYLTQEHDGSLPPGDTDWVGEFHTQYPDDPFLDGLVFGGPAALTDTTMAIIDNSLMLVNAP